MYKNVLLPFKIANMMQIPLLIKNLATLFYGIPELFGTWLGIMQSHGGGLINGRLDTLVYKTFALLPSEASPQQALDAYPPRSAKVILIVTRPGQPPHEVSETALFLIL